MSRKLNGTPPDGASGAGSPSAAPPSQSHVFDLSRRGYDRDQVDEHMRTLLGNLSATHKAHQYEYARAQQAEADLRATQAEVAKLRGQLEQAEGGQPGEGGSQGFGYRVERLLRTAEQEAAEVRSSAAREATAMLEQAREQAEAHRHDVEQSLIARTATLEQDAARRSVALDERERQIADQAAAAQAEADRLLADARGHADQLRDDARARAEAERVTVEKALRGRQEEAEQELGRLHSVHDDVRGRLGRLLGSLAAEFDEGSHPAVARVRELQAGSGASRPRPVPHSRSGRAAAQPEPVLRSPREPGDNNGGTYDHDFAQRG